MLIALKISVPLRTSPSTATGIIPPAVAAHSRRGSSVAGVPSSCLPLWLDTKKSPRPYLVAKVTSSAMYTPLIQSWSLLFCRSHGIAVSQSNEGSKPCLPLLPSTFYPACPLGSLCPSDRRLGHSMSAGRKKLFRCSFSILPSMGKLTEIKIALYPDAGKRHGSWGLSPTAWLPCSRISQQTGLLYITHRGDSL